MASEISRRGVVAPPSTWAASASDVSHPGPVSGRASEASRAAAARPRTVRAITTAVPTTQASRKIGLASTSGWNDGGSRMAPPSQCQPARKASQPPTPATRAPPSVADQRRWRTRGSQGPRTAPAMPPPRSTAVARRRTSQEGLARRHFGFLKRRSSVSRRSELRCGELAAGMFQERGGDQGTRAAEKVADEIVERGPAHIVAGGGGEVDVAGAVPLVAQIALGLEVPQHAAHGRVTRRVGQLLEHLDGAGAAEAVDDLHDLALAAAERAEGVVYHRGRQAALAGPVLMGWH